MMNTLPYLLLTISAMSSFAGPLPSSLPPKSTAPPNPKTVPISKPAANPLPLTDAEVPARELIVALKEGKSPAGFAEAYGLSLLRVLHSDDSCFVAKAPDEAAAAATKRVIATDESVRWVAYNRSSQNVRMAFVPDDPYFTNGNPPGWPGQWHLLYAARPQFDANVRGAWDRDVTGANVLIGICDDGFERTHPDLSPGYSAVDSFDFADNDTNPDPVAANDNHGTSVAGVAGARGGNGIGVCGSAPLARLAGLRLPFDGSGTTADFVDATKYHSFGTNRDIRVKNHSYGIGEPFITSDAEGSALADSAGAGTLHAISAGNERGESGEDSNKKSFQSNPHAIAVAAFASTGIFSSYSCFGANVFVTAPSNSFRAGEFGITTTDRTGNAGYTKNSDPYPDKNYEPNFGGTSSASPLVAGVLALGVQANPAITQRLAKHLLARSCDVVDAADASATSDGGWKTNNAGFRFNQNYGFGLIDADEFTRLAAQFTGITALQTEETPQSTVNAAIPDNSQLQRTTSVTAVTPLEEVEVFMDFTHAKRGDLEATLQSPRGTVSRVFMRNSQDTGSSRTQWWFTCNAFWGENPQGTWTLTLKDTSGGNTGTWSSFRLRMRMGTPIGNTVQPPVITAISPATGPAGTTVTVDGDKLSAATAITFNGTAATFTTASNTRLTATVPAAAATGRIRVTTPGGSAESTGNFTVTTVPVIDTMTPTSGSISLSVLLTGSSFTGATVVRFNGTNAAFTVNSATQITATVPAGAATGRVTVVTPSGTATSPTNFVFTAAPGITAFSPGQGATGTAIVISGSNFTGATAVRFNALNATFIVVNSTTINATAPAAVATGSVTVVTPAGIAVSTQSFNVIPTPVIANFTPDSGPDGTVVTVSGENFTGVTTVTFNNVAAATFNVDSAQQLRATAPAGVTTGAIRATTPSGSGVSTRNFTAAARAANDAFVGALILNGSSGTLAGNNASATKEGSEPNHAANAGGKSMWFRWTAPATGTVSIDTNGSEIDTILAVYTGSAVGELTPSAANDDVGDLNPTQRVTSAVSFQATSGTTYRVAVDGYNSTTTATSAAAGDFKLNWRAATVPVITGFTPAAGSVGTQINITGANFTGASAVRFNGTPATVFTAGSDTSAAAIVPAGATSGPISIVTLAGTGTSRVNFTVSLTPANDNFSSAQSLTGSSGTQSATNRAAVKESGEPVHAGNAGGASIWYSWTASQSGRYVFDTSGSDFDTLLAIYTGGGVGALTALASNDDIAPGTTASRVALDAVAGAIYRIAVDGWARAQGTVALNWQRLPAPAVSGIAPASGPAGTVVTVTGSNFTDVTSVRIGSAEMAFTVVSATQLTATVPAGVASGVITVTTTAGSAASAALLTVQGSLSNDAFAGARPLSSASVVFDSNSSATKESGEPSHAGNAGGRSLWFRWSAPSSGAWVIETADSNFDTTLAVYTGSAVGELSPTAYNDDAGGTTSRVTLDALAGTPYSIAIDGFNGSFGSVVLSIYPATPATMLLSAAFESSEGYAAGFTLSGQSNWTTSAAGGNGIEPNLIPGEGQSAFIGLNPLTSADESQFLWVPLNHSPVPARPFIRFRTKMVIYDSTNGHYDDFEFGIYNTVGDRLAALNFDNSNLAIFTKEGDIDYADSGQTFENGSVYQLEMLINYSTNRWSAWLDGNPIATNLTLGAAGQTKDLGDIDAIWRYRDITPGNNYMAFDNLTITSEASPAPVIAANPQSVTATTGATVQLVAAVSGQSPFTWQWQRNNVPVQGATSRILTLSPALTAQSGSYTLTVTNEFGSATSTAATVNIADPAASDFSVWAAGFFGNGAPVTTAGPEADPDLDAIPNLMEYAFGTHPQQVSVIPLRVTLQNSRLVAEIDRASLRTDIDYAFEASANPGTTTSWQRLSPSLNTSTLLRAVDTVSTAQSPKRWVRFRATLR